jgi:uncharacterized protein
VTDDRWQELGDAECRRLRAERHLGRLAVTDAHGPMVFPVTYAFHEGSVEFRADPGSKLDAVDEGSGKGWSVIVRGQVTEDVDPTDLEPLPALPLHPWAPGARSRYVRIRPRPVGGERIAMPAELPFTWWG